MAYDLGATVPLGVDVRDSAGNLVNADSVTLTVTLPDGSAVAPEVDSPVEAGRYSCDFVPSMPGRHVVRWTTSGPATAFVDVFHAIPDGFEAIVGLAETKRHLNIPADDDQDDEELRGFILSASMVVEDVVGVVARRAITEKASGGGRHIVLEKPPVLEVVEVRVDGVLVDSGEYTGSPSGLLAHRNGCWPAGLRNVEVTYLAGKTVVPPNIIDATLELIRINWRPQAGGNYSAFDGGRNDDFGNAGLEASLQGNLRLGFFVPNTVVQRLAPDQRGPVVL
ncbi:hypothetical protein AB0C02_28120 [Micromonospora sp. NPDC048999]|uniref:hypothetical protein n=1 Tax=Micromonospora sp. NPDC048999 TaxID=3155391 RepID=UPI0033DBB910